MRSCKHIKAAWSGVGNSVCVMCWRKIRIGVIHQASELWYNGIKKTLMELSVERKQAGQKSSEGQQSEKKDGERREGGGPATTQS